MNYCIILSGGVGSRMKMGNTEAVSDGGFVSGYRILSEL